MLNTKKIGSVLKNIENIDVLNISDQIDCQQGQLIAVKVISVNPNYNKLELISGRITELTEGDIIICLLYTSPSPRDATLSRMPSSA